MLLSSFTERSRQPGQSSVAAVKAGIASSLSEARGTIRDRSLGSFPSDPGEVMEQILLAARPRCVGGLGTASTGLRKTVMPKQPDSLLW